MTDLTVTQILDEVAATSSKNAKKAILDTHKDNEKLKTILKAAIDPYSIFYITKIPDESHIPEQFQINEELDDVSEDDIICSILSELNQNSSREHIRGMFAILGKIFNDAGNEDGLALTRKILTGELDAGIAASTVNAVWPDLINTFKVMKAEEKAHLHKMRYPALASLKMDGVRAVAFVRDGNVEVKSSSGRIFMKIPSIESAILEFARSASTSLYDGFILDGEIVAVDENGNVPRQKSNGLANKALKGSISDGEEQMLHFFAFDILSSVSQLERGLEGRPLERRLQNMIHIDPDSHLREVDSVVVEDEQQAWAEFHQRVSDGEEGIVLKAMDSIYEAKRSYEWIKLKKEYQCEVEIIDWTAHKKKEGMLGSMTMQTRDGKVVGNQGTKLSDLQRREMYEMAQRGELVGSIATIKFHDLSSKNNRETKSFYLPRFIEFRHDKHDADDLATIEAMM